MNDARRQGLRATSTRIVGLLFAAVALAGTAVWFVTGAAVPLTLTELNDAAIRTGTLYISVHTDGKQPEADAISARLHE